MGVPTLHWASENIATTGQRGNVFTSFPLRDTAPQTGRFGGVGCLRLFPVDIFETCPRSSLAAPTFPRPPAHRVGRHLSVPGSHGRTGALGFCRPPVARWWVPNTPSVSDIWVPPGWRPAPRFTPDSRLLDPFPRLCRPRLPLLYGLSTSLPQEVDFSCESLRARTPMHGANPTSSKFLQDPRPRCLLCVSLALAHLLN